MLITLAIPTSTHALSGNRVTAERWARLLGELGHEVTIREGWNGEACDLLVALHAVKSFPSIERFRAQRAAGGLVVALVGTDIDPEHERPELGRAIALADRLVVLQPAALERLPVEARPKSVAIQQSVAVPRIRGTPSAVAFEVCLLSHLREVKAPLLGARALRRLPPTSRIRLLHAGAALDASWERAARDEERDNPRYRWLGPLARDAALQQLGRSRLLLLTSRAEGGANVVPEAIALGVPVLSSRIEGSLGQLGADYPGYFEPGDEAGLASLLARAESDAAFLAALRERTDALRPLFTPERERDAWRALLASACADR